MNEVVTIELARAGDLERITSLVNRAGETGTANFATSPEPLEQWIDEWEKTSSTHPWLVARSSGDVLGFAKASAHRARGAYRWTAEVSIYIDEERRARGLGTALYGVLIPFLGAQGFVTLLAGITAGHTASERLHARAGFIRCGTFHRAGWKMGGWHDVGYWELQLGGGLEPAPVRGVAEVWEARGGGGLSLTAAPRR
ncbi:MAG TPA: GNAT family N-acetyltransferase [Kofleriaceae bacterium]|nr:GNAT family N-acetyltransferase [Kofleriaceae bacterium]